MRDVINRTDARHAAFPIVDKDGREVLVVVAKASYAIDADGAGERLTGDEAAYPYVADECYGDDPATSSIRKPSDLFQFKPGTDVLLIGHAWGQGGADGVDVSLRVGPVHKVVRAYGMRVWRLGVGNVLVPGDAEPIVEPVPLIYELAWGGMDLSDPDNPVGEQRNYLGRGVCTDPQALVGRPAAQLEYPRSLMGKRDRTPACFGALHRHWQPRMSFAGTYDEHWQDTKMPIPPDDFDPRFNVSVAHDQWSLTPLRGGEEVEVLGATADQRWRFTLPRFNPGFSSWLGNTRREHRTHLDTVLIDSDARRVEMTWRAAIELPRKYEMLKTVAITEKTQLW